MIIEKCSLMNNWSDAAERSEQVFNHVATAELKVCDLSQLGVETTVLFTGRGRCSGRRSGGADQCHSLEPATGDQSKDA